ncbi:hypothetical protein IW262DRAFT_1459412 [Armillaria fumosa]|nr:hypothetical protein IW262DRAFT_1459412 [Armillaria fumosa]
MLRARVLVVSLLPRGRHTSPQQKALGATTAYYRTTTMMDSEETSIEHWKRFNSWWDSKKWIISNFWQKAKRSVSTLWCDKGNASVCDNAPELNFYKVARNSLPITHQFHLPVITLSALAETGHAELTIPVLKQRSYTSNKPVISSALADTPCADLGTEGVLKKLNATLGTSYSLRSQDFRPLSETTLHSILEPYVARNDDFGTVYAHMRACWYYYDASEIEDDSRIMEEIDRNMREVVLVHGGITRPDVPPRRVWDLYANRVVPFWVVHKVQWYVWGISHAWVNENDRVNAMTPINGYEWPVPMPKDANLDLIRIEMLNLGAEYAWLDVLCLRQEGGKGEYLRLEEWKLDVPTIGAVYSFPAPVVCYFNGLGRPLHLTPHYFESDRCWFRRAWTLQEITEDAIIGGETGNDPMEPEVQRRFDEQLCSLREIRRRGMILEIVAQMQHRVSTKALDKVAGLVYLLGTHSIPIYKPEQSEVDAWEVLMDRMSPWNGAALFFHYPEPGNGKKRW